MKNVFNSAEIWPKLDHFNENVELPADAVDLSPEDRSREDTPTCWLLLPSTSARISDH